MNELTNEKLYDVITQWKAICQKETDLNHETCKQCPVAKICSQIDDPIPMNWIVKEECR